VPTVIPGKEEPPSEAIAEPASKPGRLPSGVDVPPTSEPTPARGFAALRKPLGSRALAGSPPA